MTQIATIRRTLNNGMAEAAVRRQSACGHDCSKCNGCEQTVKLSEIVVTAENRVKAQRGDTVIIESKSATILTAAAMVYIFPILLAFLFSGLTAWFIGDGEGMQMLACFLGFVTGILISIMWDKRMRKNRLKYWISKCI